VIWHGDHTCRRARGDRSQEAALRFWRAKEKARFFMAFILSLIPNRGEEWKNNLRQACPTSH
jgi:hypothetical protein